MSEGGIRVLVAASSHVVRAGLEAVLARDPGIRVVGSVAPGARLGVAAAGLPPDVILVEREPADEDLAAVPLDAWEGEGIPVVLLSDAADEAPGAALDALRAGARAVLARDADPAAIAAAVRAAAAGLVVVGAEAIAAMLAGAPAATGGGASRDGEEHGAPPLTPRELEVLGMLAEGLGNKRIAARLAISEHTVKYHLASIYAKLRVSTRTEAVMAGARRGLVMV